MIMAYALVVITTKKPAGFLAGNQPPSTVRLAANTVSEKKGEARQETFEIQQKPLSYSTHPE